MNRNDVIKSDCIVIGSGISGALTSLLLSKFSNVSLITKSYFLNSNSALAQGGISCVVDGENDNINKHIEDTINAGRHINNYDVVRGIISNAPNYMYKFIKEYDICFTRENDKDENSKFHLGLEGGHQCRRILHCGDQTGKIILQQLFMKCNSDDKINIFSEHIAVELIVVTSDKNQKMCIGVVVFDNKHKKFKLFFAKCIIMSTGGVGMVYSKTTNSNIACGDGIRMAHEVGANIKNMEFIQFHPTALNSKNSNQSVLISEAFRGEGAKLKIKRDNKYVEFMHKYSSDMLELAPRDVVAMSIYKELQINKQDNVYIDITDKNSDFLKRRFPYVYDICQSYGIDISTDLIPVAPAEHYCCGGIDTNIIGDTNISGLYAVGESSCNGFHGANRLASNSLLETIVVPYFLSERLSKILDKIEITNFLTDSFFIDIFNKYNNKIINEDIELDHFICNNVSKIRDTMWKYAGIIRSREYLIKAKNIITSIKNEIRKYNSIFNTKLFELESIVNVSDIILNCALNRRESIGTHFISD